MDKLNISIARDFTPTPGPRYEKEGDWSGEIFRKTKLFPLVEKAIRENKILKVDLDGVIGYGTSFLEEIFGGLIREQDIDFKQLKSHLEIKSDEEPFLIDDINHYLNDASVQKVANRS